MPAPKDTTPTTSVSLPRRASGKALPSGGARNPVPARHRARLRHDVAVVAAELRRMRHAALTHGVGTGSVAPMGH